MPTNRLLPVLRAPLAVAGCAARPINEPIARPAPSSGCRPYLPMPRRVNNDRRSLSVFAFSGGGTRAAALSYGMLEDFRRADRPLLVRDRGDDEGPAGVYGWRRGILLRRARLAGATESQAEASIPLPKLPLHTVDVGCDGMRQPDERTHFMNLPTSFVLPAADAARLREVAGRLLRQSEDDQVLLRKWGAPPR